MKFLNSTFYALRSRKGFTLIEVLIVVAIIAILASVVLVGLGPTRRLGRDSRRISDLGQVQNGLELYFNKCGYYPGGQAAGSCTGYSAISGWSALQDALTGTGSSRGYLGITSIANDPTAGKDYCYTASSGGTGYILGAQLEDTSNPALRGSLDTGACGSLTCSRTTGVYCVQL